MVARPERDDLWDPKITYVIGHQRPDMDAIGSALAYAWYLTEEGYQNVVPARAGQVGSQACFALSHFHVRAPRFLATAAPTFRHVARHQEFVGPDAPLAAAMTQLSETERIVPVVDDDGLLMGALSPLALARAYAYAAEHNQNPVTQTCQSIMGQFPKYGTHERIRDHRNMILRSEGDAFLVVGKDGRYFGTTTRQQILSPPRAKLVLVDHNELPQAIVGADEAEIISVLDHHRLGNAPTAAPIPFVIEPVGSTCTLVAEACRAQNHIPPSELAGVMLSGILSDTLIFRSPTTTERDQVIAIWLAELCHTDMAKYGQDLVHSSPGLADRSADDIVDADRKTYQMADKSISISQVEVSSFQELPDRRVDLLEALDTRRVREGLAVACLMVTDVITVESHLLCVGDQSILGGLPFSHVADNEFDLEDMVSRKKQLVPALQSVLEEIG